MFWLSRSDLGKYPLVPDFENMLKVFDEDTLSEFYYYTEENGSWGLKLL